MASMIDFKQLMKEERERFKQQTKKNATTLTSEPKKKVVITIYNVKKNYLFEIHFN